MGCGLEASCMCIGISRHASRGPLEGSFEATWGPRWRRRGRRSRKGRALLALPGAFRATPSQQGREERSTPLLLPLKARPRWGHTLPLRHRDRPRSGNHARAIPCPTRAPVATRRALAGSRSSPASSPSSSPSRHPTLRKSQDGRLGALLGSLGRLLGRLGALLGRLGCAVGASWAVFEQSLEVLGLSRSVGRPKRQKRQKHRKTN